MFGKNKNKKIKQLSIRKIECVKKEVEKIVCFFNWHEASYTYFFVVFLMFIVLFS